jgi:hypothetical protein
MAGYAPATALFPGIIFKLTGIVALVIVFSSNCLSAQPKVDPNALVKVGDYRDISMGGAIRAEGVL